MPTAKMKAKMSNKRPNTAKKKATRHTLLKKGKC